MIMSDNTIFLKSQEVTVGSDNSSDVPSFGHHLHTASQRPDRICFYAISDFGNITKELQRTAAAMNRYAEQNGSPDFIVGLGDNFYPYGPQSSDDSMFEDVWRAQFIKPYPALQVPWRMVLGNHDYYGNPQSQVDYHYNRKKNKDNLWYMPSRYYSFSTSTESNVSADFFVMDTNAVELDICANYENVIPDLQVQIQRLDTSLHSSNATWRVAFAHHPMYTAGWGHGRAGHRLRSDEPTEFFGQTFPGFGLESICANHQLDGFFAGHEHVFQAHNARGVQHFCCGASGAEIRPGNGLYRGKDTELELDWVAQSHQYGFVVVELTAATMTTKFIQHDGKVLREFTREKCYCIS